MTAEPPSDHEAEPLTSIHVRRAIGGDRTSVSWLVTRLTPLLRAQAKYRLGPHLARFYDADDLVQEAWLTMLPRIDAIVPRDGRHTPVLLKFLSTVLINRTNSLGRKHIRDRRLGENDDRAPKTLSEVPEDATGIVTGVLHSEREDAVHRVLDELDEADREVIVLRGIEQVGAQDAAMLLGITSPALSMRYSRALAKLRARLPDSVFDELDDRG